MVNLRQQPRFPLRRKRVHHSLEVSIRLSVYKLPISSFSGLSFGSTSGASSQLILISCNEINKESVKMMALQIISENECYEWLKPFKSVRPSNLRQFRLLQFA